MGNTLLYNPKGVKFIVRHKFVDDWVDVDSIEDDSYNKDGTIIFHDACFSWDELKSLGDGIQTEKSERLTHYMKFNATEFVRGASKFKEPSASIEIIGTFYGDDDNNYKLVLMGDIDDPSLNIERQANGDYQFTIKT